MRKIVPVILVMFLFSACSKNSNTQSGQANIIAHQWFANTVTINTVVDSCAEDDYFVFNSDGSGYKDNGIRYCDTESIKDYIFTYTLSPDNKTITLNNFTHPGKTVNVSVRENDNNTLEIVYSLNSHLYDYVLKPTAK